MSDRQRLIAALAKFIAGNKPVPSVMILDAYISEQRTQALRLAEESSQANAMADALQEIRNLIHPEGHI